MDITFASEIRDGFLIKTAFFGEENYYLKIPSEYKEEITDLADPLVILLIFRMMRQGGGFHIKGTVSKSLLDNLELFASYWRVLAPEFYKAINITADEEVNDIHIELSNKAVAAFSGGLDASFMLYRHKKNLAGRNNKNIEKCVFIKGFDMMVNTDERLQRAFSDGKKICDDAGVELVSVETNYRQYPHVFGYEFIAILAAALRLWKEYPYQMIGTSYPVNDLRIQWGDNPVTANLLSSSCCKVLCDDIDFSRTEKAVFIKDWNTAVKNLRVCWGTTDDYLNCGTCEKCIRTYLNFEAAGIYNLPGMSKPLNIKNLRNLDFNAFTGNEYYLREFLEYAKKNGIKIASVAELEKEINLRKKQIKWSKITHYRCLLLSKLMPAKKKRHYLEKAKKYDAKPKKLKLESVKFFFKNA